LGKSSKQKAASTSNTARTINIMLIVGALAVTGGIVWYTLRDAGPSAPRQELPKPNVATLDPKLFTGRTRIAYEAAKEVPQVLAQLPCYCGCMSSPGHKNNLDCFHDEHGVECAMCQSIALDARDMWNDGYDIERIRQAVKDRYGRSAALTE
jgi:hypothetical protein